MLPTRAHAACVCLRLAGVLRAGAGPGCPQLLHCCHIGTPARVPALCAKAPLCHHRPAVDENNRFTLFWLECSLLAGGLLPPTRGAPLYQPMPYPLPMPSMRDVVCVGGGQCQQGSNRASCSRKQGLLWAARPACCAPGRARVGPAKRGAPPRRLEAAQPACRPPGLRCRLSRCSVSTSGYPEDIREAIHRTVEILGGAVTPHNMTRRNTHLILPEGIGEEGRRCASDY